ncbi:MAG: agmatinase [Acidimicrobiales bacterium]
MDDADVYAIASAPFAGPLTFARAPFDRDPTDADIVVVGVPFDGGTTYRPGARLGPRAVREQSVYVGQYPWGHWPWDAQVLAERRLVDWGDIAGTVFWAGYPQRMVRDVRAAVDPLLASGASVLGLGGDHMVAYPLVAATAERHGPLALVHIDAHSDTWDMGDDLNHGTMFRLAAQEGWIVPDHSIQVGIRTPNPDTCGFRVVDADTVLDRPLAETVAEVRARVGGLPVYVSFDIDALDPAFAPGTGTPVAGGLTTREARVLLRGLAGLRIVGADLVEVAPALDPSDATAIAAATLALDLAHLLALGRPEPAPAV